MKVRLDIRALWKMGKIRNYINRRFVESNRSLVDAMLYTNKIHGRRKNVITRACLIVQIYIKYVILRSTVAGERQKAMKKALYSESRVNQASEIQNIIHKLAEYDCTTFDLLGVLFYEALDIQQLFALMEVNILWGMCIAHFTI